ncbi:TolC family protein, partial [Klebsiella pneumoniae]
WLCRLSCRSSLHVPCRGENTRSKCPFKFDHNSLDAISRYGEQLTELQEQETVAQETLRIAQNRYRNGYSSYLDVLDAQRTLFSTQLSVVQVKNNLLLAQIDLYRALGGGWSDSSGS